MDSTFKKYPNGSIFILDTSYVTSDGVSKIDERIKKFIYSYEHFSLYTTPSCLKELAQFISVEELSKYILIKNPNVSEMTFPASLMMEFISESRKRNEEATKYAVSLVKEAYKTVPESTPSQKYNRNDPNRAPDPDGTFVSRMRDGIRKHTREGIIDSTTDFEILLLGIEFSKRTSNERTSNVFIFTKDTGMMKWCDKLGLSHTT
jgi:predicted DNA-binding protein (UPF0278 family)